VDLIGKSSEATLYAVRFQPGCLETRCWGNELFDCFVLNCLPEDNAAQIEAIAKEVAKTRTEWVHALGGAASALHDAVDKMSVSLGRQAEVGDGIPMTSWHEDLRTIDAMAGFVVSGGLGRNCDYAVAIVVGSEIEYQTVLDAIRRQWKLRSLTEA
jgi:hypothetical protein